jgi:hypothetical protein
MKRILGACCLLLLVSSALWAASAKERRFIYVGMSEGEVLEKVGAPDYESYDTADGAGETVKRWIYFPTPDDWETITTVVLRRGKVIQVMREISR